jgi:formylglycine-generating enzyme required for sulfatase activity
MHLVRTGKGTPPPQWYVNGQGQTIVVIPGPVEFLMGSPPTEQARRDIEGQHKKRIGRTFAIAASAVTLGQFQKYFRVVFKTNCESEERFTPKDECPANYITWYMAAAYCNWLSQQEGTPQDQWCYVTGTKGKVTRQKKNYLSLAGYRLPTEAEMEYATRAGTLTSRYYGETEELLPKYAWYSNNSKEQTWPVGSLKPNDLGLFDMHGNVYHWCQESYQNYPNGKHDAVMEDKEDALAISSTTKRVMRGESFSNHSLNVRSARRENLVPTTHLSVVGFRPARTLTL